MVTSRLLATVTFNLLVHSNDKDTAKIIAKNSIIATDTEKLLHHFTKC
jgi:hypothetical protein